MDEIVHLNNFCHLSLNFEPTNRSDGIYLAFISEDKHFILYFVLTSIYSVSFRRRFLRI